MEHYAAALEKNEGVLCRQIWNNLHTIFFSGKAVCVMCCNSWTKGETISIFMESMEACIERKWLQCLHLGRETKDYKFGVEEKLPVLTLYSNYLNCFPSTFIHFSVKRTKYVLKYSTRDCEIGPSLPFHKEVEAQPIHAFPQQMFLGATLGSYCCLANYHQLSG